LTIQGENIFTKIETVLSRVIYKKAFAVYKCFLIVLPQLPGLSCCYNNQFGDVIANCWR